MFSFCVLLWTNLIPKFKIVSLSWNLEPRLFRICKIWWWCSFSVLGLFRKVCPKNLLNIFILPGWSPNSLFPETWSQWLFLSTCRNSRPEMFWKKLFLKILQNSQENTCARFSFLINLQAWGPQLYYKKNHLSCPCSFVSVHM